MPPFVDIWSRANEYKRPLKNLKLRIMPQTRKSDGVPVAETMPLFAPCRTPWSKGPAGKTVFISGMAALQVSLLHGHLRLSYDPWPRSRHCTGTKLANPELDIWVISGDGDAPSPLAVTT